MAGENLDHVGEVVFASQTIGLNFVDVSPKERRIEAIEARVHFFDLALIAGSRFFFDDFIDVAIHVAHDAGRSRSDRSSRS